MPGAPTLRHGITGPARRARAVALALAGLATLSPALDPARAERLAADGVVVEVVDGDTVRLSSGLEVRLVGIQAPKLPLGRPNFKSWPLAVAAKATLEQLVGGARVRLAYGGRRRDRHGRALAHLYQADERWVQGEMLRRGMARVYTFADNTARIAEMLALERAARAAGRGIWSHPFYKVRAVTETPDFLHSFQIVEGRVEAAAVVRGRVYLNFGPDWRTDFTVTIAPGDVRRFKDAGLAPARWDGRMLRVRGWLKRYNGPMIEATHPEQIELLAE